MNVNLKVSGTNFLNGRASQGGAIYISGDSDISMSGVNFSKNKASDSGGAIFASSFSTLSIYGKSTFVDNYALYGVGDIYAEFCNQSFSLKDTSFTNSVADQIISMS